MRKKWAAAAVIAVSSLALAGCSPSAPEGDGVLTLWHFEAENSAMGIAWDEAIKVFEEETGATVEFEEKSFEQIRQTASQVLNSDQAPDILEYTKGNATAGLLASQGLLTPITESVEEYGWADKLAPALQTTARYSEDGVMGSGEWYGVPNYGEFVTVYYNKAAFAEQGIEVPTTMAEFEGALKTFADAGITPLAQAGLEYPLGQLWYQFLLQESDRDFVNDYQLYEGEVDWQSDAMKNATDKVVEYVDAGYISPNASGLKAEDAGVSFINGDAPIFVSGSWWYGRFADEISGFDWGIVPFPETELSLGSAGNMWVVPAAAGDPDLATQFIEITMRPEIQALIGNNGGLPVAANVDDITDPKSQELISAFNDINEKDGLAFYPDWPTPTFYDELVAQLQELVNKTKTSDEVLDSLGQSYDSYAVDFRE
ncbi:MULTISPECIES: ABC transporter substrate-binding protein [unclassified Pseudoclavibacter]|uniref:ABC transporter substrate-binding protein n=1 Tax=unclassified Pseudoclavibacter TaxID=2615177 RepID=UPI000CE76AA2|nr:MULTISPECIES: extracellular solute-binding protein [unclassified Pseudoclavibacter]MBS3179014.1 extracellular solute-binding protein [Pseudoclavibacter sp. Marseille-Q4354]PPG32225.1 sugar ABC transporter substrate-binding protein [Pseudoclavibacter sp. RFBB5]